MSIDTTTFENEIKSFISTLSGVLVYWEGFDRPKPKTRHITLDTLSMPKNHEDHVGHKVDDVDNTIKVSGQRTAIIRVMVVGSSDTDTESPMQMANTLISKMSLPSSQEALSEKNISIIDQSTPQDISALIDGTQWEKRSYFDATFGASFEISDDVGYFENLEIRGEAKGENGSVEDIEIDL